MLNLPVVYIYLWPESRYIHFEKILLTIFSIPQETETMELVMDTVGDQHLVDVIVTMHVTLMMIVAMTRLMSVGQRNLLPDPVPVSFLVILICYNLPVADPRVGGRGGLGTRDPHGPISFINMQPPAKKIGKQYSIPVGCVPSAAVTVSCARFIRTVCMRRIR